MLTKHEPKFTHTTYLQSINATEASHFWRRLVDPGQVQVLIFTSEALVQPKASRHGNWKKHCLSGEVVTIWLWLTVSELENPHAKKVLQTIYFYGPWLPWRTVSHNQMVLHLFPLPGKGLWILSELLPLPSASFFSFSFLNCELQISVGMAVTAHWDLVLTVEVHQCPCQRECPSKCPIECQNRMSENICHIRFQMRCQKLRQIYFVTVGITRSKVIWSK